MKRALISITAVVALAVPLSAPAGTSATRLAGTTGPGFTITLKKAGKRVTSLKAGRYTFTVRDRSRDHDFVLVGPGVRNRMITGLAFTGTSKPVTLRLRRGVYTYYCTPHRSQGMKGTFRVT
jgi:Copper binding proteins, plastocyanin/azurin family